MDVSLAERPESISRLVINSLKLYSKALPRVFILSLILSVLVFIPRIVALFYQQQNALVVIQNWPARLVFIAIDFGFLFIFTAMLWRVRCVLYREIESFRSDLQKASRKFLYILAAAIIQGIFFAIFLSIAIAFAFYLAQNPNNPGQLKIDLTIACLFAIYGWVILYFYYLLVFYLPLILTEDKGILSSLKKSIYLVWGNWWRTFWFLLIPWLCYLIVLIILQKIFHLSIHIYLLEFAAPPTWISTIIHILIFAIYMPWFAAALLIQLRDLELRKK